MSRATPAERLQALSPEKRRLVEMELAARDLAVERLAITRRPGNREFPLSFAQERLWFLHQLDPGSTAYHLSTSTILRGALHVPALSRALGELMRRQESLRTSFPVLEEQPVQRVHETLPITLPTIDLRRLRPEDRDAEGLLSASRWSKTAFELSRGPLFRVALLRLGVGEYRFLLTMHHIISDGWSLGVLLRELSVFYEAFRKGEVPELSELPVQVGDFSYWQRQWLRGEVLEKELAYWRRQLAGAPPVLALPADRPRPAIQSFRGSVRPLLLSPAIDGGLRRFAKRAGTTPFVVLLAAFKVLLARLSGQSDVCVGTPIAGRHREEIEGLIGFFVNTLVLRSDLRDDPPFRNLVERVNGAVLDAHAHQELPFEKLVQELQPERSLAHSPLFQVMFAMLNIPRGVAGPDEDPAGLRVYQGGSLGEAAQFDLHLEISDHRERLSGSLQYATDLFDATTVTRWIRQFERVLEGVAETGDLRLSRLPALAPHELVQVSAEWNDTARTYPSVDSSLHGLFEARVPSTAEAVAVSCGDRYLSYLALDRRAERLARNLGPRLRPSSRADGAEVLVAISMERSIDLIVGLLAILKAGAAWVPLDASYPPDRLAFLLRDVAAPVLLTQRSLAAGLPSSGVAVVAIDQDPSASAEPGSDLPGASAGGSRAAYVIYTSGTTGRPKGAVNSHGAIVNRLLWMQEAYRLGADDRVLQKTPFSFDVSVWELFWPLAAGARLVFARPGGHRDPAYLAKSIRDRRITTLHFVPSMLQAFLQASALPDSAALRRVIVSGEALTAELRDQFHERSAAELHNLYGPTEAAIDVTHHAVARGEQGPVPIGRPIANLRLLVLDGAGRPAPIGVAGELMIGGAGLARGYHRRPSLTAERFVPDGQGEKPGERLYRTGDLAGFRRDGEIEFLGRLDHQVKIRGFRVELGEIETRLLQHPAITEAVCLVREDSPGDSRLVAFLVPEGGDLPEAAELRSFVGEKLPEHMIPAFFVSLEALPTTPNGKLDRAALARWEIAAAGAPRSAYAAPSGETERMLAEIWCQVLGVERVGARDNFFDLGGHSLLLVQVQGKVRERLGRELPIVEFFRHPTVRDLAGALAPEGGRATARPPRRRRRPARADGAGGSRPREIAVVGMAGRFPKACDLQEFWRNLCDGVEGVTFYSDDELAEEGIPRHLLDDPSYVKACAFLDGPADFDARLFGIPPREAQVMDPQQRIFLECAWEVLEDAGYDPETWEGAVGVFGGLGLNYYLLNLLSNPELVHGVGFIPVAVANANDYLATRVSYKLGLTGPSLSVQTACSTSLVATHLACESLRRGECDMALAGGVSVAAFGKTGYHYQEGGILSPDGHCRPFDARAGGTLAGNGAGIVALKRLADAERDGDRIRAVIRGSAINNDGSLKVGFTAPSVDGQAEVIAEALRVAGVTPEEVSYVEAHGSATPLGDPIEVAALQQVLGGRRAGKCALGAVKSNIGHTDAAAGIAGLIKTVLALEHRQIPPTLHFEEPNPEIDFAASPLYVNIELTDWSGNGAPRRAGVSAFGLGGTNVHVVLEEAAPVERSETLRKSQVLAFSAASEPALEALTDRWAGHLQSADASSLADAVHTAHLGRRRLEHRRVLVGSDPADMSRALRERDPRVLLSGTEERSDRPVAFLFPGLGDQSVHMARALFRIEPTFRAEVDRCCELLEPHLGLDLRDVLYPAGEEPDPAHSGAEPDLRRLLGRRDRGESDADRLLNETRLAQPAVFVVEYALARLWRQWGIEPEAMIGYSLGEYTAACLAGVMRLEDALAVVALRARWIDGLPAGAMLAVPFREKDARPLLESHGLSLAAVNSPQVSVAAGPEAAIAALETELVRGELVSQRLRTTHAFHSSMMEPLAERFAERMRDVELSAPKIPYLSNVSGTWITPAEATDPEYWARHLCQTVRFTDGLRELYRNADRLLLEVGPGQALATSARQHPARLDGHLVLSSLGDSRGRQSDEEALLNTLGRLWLGGAAVDWRGFWSHERRRKVPIPTYPFERQRFFLDGRTLSPGRRRPSGKLKDVADWFHVPRWQLAPPVRLEPAELEARPGTWLILSDGRGLGALLGERLVALGQRVVSVRPGAGFKGVHDRRATLDPRRPEDFAALLEDLQESDSSPRHVVHLWSLTDGDGSEPAFDETQALGTYSLLSLARSLATRGLSDELRLTVVSNGVDGVDGREALYPAKATMVGALKVIPQEYRNLSCRIVDVDLPAAAGPAEDRLVDRLLAELADADDGHAPERRVAYRRGSRWVRRYDRLSVPAVGEERVGDGSPGFKPQGVYLITGGFGKVGGILSRYLAETVGARGLILTGLATLPEREAWDGYLASHGDSDGIGRRILHLRELEAAGAEVLGLSADAADREQMAGVLEEIRERFGRLDGIVHLAGSLADEKLFVPVEKTDPEVCRWHFEPKAVALRVLAGLLAAEPFAEPPDFSVLFSSMASVLGGLGFAAYAAGNTFMDAFAEAQSRVSPFPWMSLNWDGWLAPDERVEPASDGLGASVAELGMVPEESTEALRRALSMLPAPRLVISVGDLETRLDQWVRFESADEDAAEEASGSGGLGARPDVHTPYVAPRGETEERIAELWRDLLGIAEVGVHDNFFELGGDSLLGTQLVSRLRQTLHVELPMLVFFEAPTVAQLAEIAEQGKYQREELSEIAATLEKIKALSASEIREEIERRSETSDRETSEQES